MAETSIIHWFRRDLRLADNAGLTAAAAAGRVLPVFILSPKARGDSAHGGASRWWLHHSLDALASDLLAIGSRLTLCIGTAADVLGDVARGTYATAVHCERLYEPAALAEDSAVRSELARAGVELKIFDGPLLTPPERVRSGEGRPFRVFTPFWRAAAHFVREATRATAPTHLELPLTLPISTPLPALDLLPRVDWARGFGESWQPGERGALAALSRFAGDGLQSYARRRDIPGLRGTSRFSPHLHFGEISVGRAWHALSTLRGASADVNAETDSYLRQLGWREFAYYILYHFPQTTDAELDSAMDGFPWSADDALVEQWRRGLVSREGPALRLARGRGVVLGHPRRCRPGQQHARLAVGCRLWRRCCAVLPCLQSGASG